MVPQLDPAWHPWPRLRCVGGRSQPSLRPRALAGVGVGRKAQVAPPFRCEYGHHHWGSHCRRRSLRCPRSSGRPTTGRCGGRRYGCARSYRCHSTRRCCHSSRRCCSHCRRKSCGRSSRHAHSNRRSRSRHNSKGHRRTHKANRNRRANHSARTVNRSIRRSRSQC